MAENAVHENVQRSFGAFFEGWLSRKQTLLERLLRVSVPLASPESACKMEEQQKTVIEQVLSHYEQYFHEKCRVADMDVFLLFSPSWLSSYERALLWISDYRPSLLLRLVDRAVDGLTPDQGQRLEQLKMETKRKERELTVAMAKVQESVAGPSLLQLARRVGKIMDGEMDTSVEELKSAMVGILERADELRVSTVMKMVGILSSIQMIKFLAAVAQFQLRVRSLGVQRDTEPRMLRVGSTSSD